MSTEMMEDVVVVDGSEVVENESTPEGEEYMDVVGGEVPLEIQILEKIEATGYAYVYEGRVLDETKLSMKSKTYIIYNNKTGLPFIYDGNVVKYGSKIEAGAALYALMMFTGNNELMLLDFEELKGKSML